MRLVVTLAEPLGATQPETGLPADGQAEPDVAALMDRLVNRLGGGASRAPSRSRAMCRNARCGRAAACPAPGRNWPLTLPRPVRLLDPPQPVEAMALLPDQPPVQFVWRRVRHRVRRSDGPERVSVNGGSAQPRSRACAIISQSKTRPAPASGCSARATASILRPAIFAGSCMDCFERMFLILRLRPERGLREERGLARGNAFVAERYKDRYC